MASNSQYTFQSFTSSYSSSSVNGQTQSHSESTYSDPSGTHVYRTCQKPGQAPRKEHFQLDSTGKRVEGADSANTMRIQDVTDEEQAKNDRLYEERMEDEYAKREGGA